MSSSEKPSSEKKHRPPKQHTVDPSTSPEKVIKFTYDVHEDKWTQTTGYVILEATPFDEGSMRAAFCMTDPSRPEGFQRYVAKMSKNPKEDLTIYFMDVEMQALAKLFADEYNKRGPPKLVDFNEASVIKCLERRGQPLLAVEPWLDGKFNKYSNNYGFISYQDRNTPQAFSHFTYCHSGGKLLICDIQGVGDKYTDPQIHSRDGRGFGKGNLGYEGMLKFFTTHRCNSICRFLNLPQHNPKSDNEEAGHGQNKGGSSAGGGAVAAQQGVAEGDKRAAAAAAAAAAIPSVAGEKASGGGDSPRDAQRRNKDIENPLDLDFLGLNQAQFDYITRHFNQYAKEPKAKLGKTGLVELCKCLGTDVTLEDAASTIWRLDRDHSSIDLRQFLWWWCGIEE